jgi:hypothetical protein
MAIGKNREGCASNFLFKDVEVFSGFEANGFAGSDRHFGAGAGISSDSGFTRLHGEDAESSQFNPVSFGEGLLHGLEDGVDGCFGLGAYEPGPFDNALDEILFNQRGTFQSVLLGCPAGKRVDSFARSTVADGRNGADECQSGCP